MIDVGIAKQIEEMMTSLAEGLGADASPDEELSEEARSLESHEFIRTASIEKGQEEEFSRYVYRLELTDITRLSEAVELVMEGELFGNTGSDDEEINLDLDMERADRGSYKLTGSLDVTRPEEEGGQQLDPLGATMARGMFGDAAFTFRVHAPAASHNGEEVDGAVQWSILFADVMMGESLEMEAELVPVRASISARAAIGLSLGTATLLGGLLWLLLQGRRRRAAAIGPSEAQRYWVSDGGDPRGPYRREEILMMSKAGRLSPASQIAVEGDGQWSPLAGHLRTLAAEVARRERPRKRAKAGAIALIVCGAILGVVSAMALLGSGTPSRSSGDRKVVTHRTTAGDQREGSSPTARSATKAPDPRSGGDRFAPAEPQFVETPTIVTYEAPGPEPRSPKDLLLEMEARSATDPADTILAMQVAALAVWLGENEQYKTTSMRMLEWAEGRDEFEVVERVAKICSIRPQSEPRTRERVVALAKRGVELVGDDAYKLAWANLALGMAEFQVGGDREAHAAFDAAIAEPDEANSYVLDTAGFYMAMLFQRNDNPSKAKEWFEETEDRIPPLPRDGGRPPIGSGMHDMFIRWLAYKQAGAVLELPMRKGEAFWEDAQRRRQAMEAEAEQWDKLDGEIVTVPANPQGRPAPTLTPKDGEQLRLYPHPLDRWNSSPARWPSVDFRGHLDTGETTRAGRPYMQLCYRAGGERLEPVEPGAIVAGSAPLQLLPSDVEGDGKQGNNTGFIRVKVTGATVRAPAPAPDRRAHRPQGELEDERLAVEEGRRHYVVDGAITTTLPPQEGRDPASGFVFALAGPDFPVAWRPGSSFSFPLRITPVGSGRIIVFDRSASSIARLVDSTGRDLGRKEQGVSISLGQKTDKPSFGMLMLGSLGTGTTVIVNLPTPPAPDAEFLSIEGIMSIMVSPESGKRTSEAFALKQGTSVRVGGEIMEVSRVSASERGQSISLHFDKAGPGKEGIELLDAEGEALDSPMEMSIGDSVTLIYSGIKPPLERLQFSYHPDVEVRGVPYKLKIPLE